MLSMSCLVYHHHEAYFPRGDEFLPSRWIGEKAAAEAEKNFIAFSRGSRNCIGMHFAYAELYHHFAYIFRRFEMIQAESMKDEDMDWHDAFVVATYGHLRVKVKRAEG